MAMNQCSMDRGDLGVAAAPAAAVPAADPSAPAAADSPGVVNESHPEEVNQEANETESLGVPDDYEEKARLVFGEIGPEFRDHQYTTLYGDPDFQWCISGGGERRWPQDFPSGNDLAGVSMILGMYPEPCSWYKVGIKAADQLKKKLGQDLDRPPEGWTKAYHGTQPKNLKSIMADGLILRDPLKSTNTRGTAGAMSKMEIGKDGRRKKTVTKVPIYLTPSIEYAAHFLYTTTLTKDKGTADLLADASRVYAGRSSPSGGAAAHADKDLSSVMSLMSLQDDSDDEDDEDDGVVGWRDLVSHSLDLEEAEPDVELKFIQFVFEVFVDPQALAKCQGNTLSPGIWPLHNKKDPASRLPFDVNFPYSAIEWLTYDSSRVVVTGLMMRTLTIHPMKYNNNRIKAMKKHVGWNDDENRAQRPRNHGGKFDECGLEGKEVKWQWNSSPSEGPCLARGRSRKSAECSWTDYDRSVSELIEHGYQRYQRYVYLGAVDGEPRFVDFGGWCLELSPEERKRRKIKPHPYQFVGDKDRELTYRGRAVRRVAADTQSHPPQCSSRRAPPAPVPT